MGEEAAMLFAVTVVAATGVASMGVAAMGFEAEAHWGAGRIAAVQAVVHTVEACCRETTVVGPEALWAMFGTPG